MLELYQTVLGLKFQVVADAPTWHQDVQMYEVTDKATSGLVGYFYLDLFPRDGKYTHAGICRMGRSRDAIVFYTLLHQPALACSLASRMRMVRATILLQQWSQTLPSQRQTNHHYSSTTR